MPESMTRFVSSIAGVAVTIGLIALSECTTPPPPPPAPSGCQLIDGTFTSSQGAIAHITQTGCSFEMTVGTLHDPRKGVMEATGHVDQGDLTLTVTDGEGCKSERRGRISDVTPLSFVSHVTGSDGKCGAPREMHDVLIWTRTIE
jgi:hypothetical protein